MWPNQFNICDERTAYVDLSRSENVPEFMWTNPGDYGDSRRKRLKPETLCVEWRRDFRSPDWKLWDVWITGRYVHKSAASSMSIHFATETRNVSGREIEPWMEPLIAATHPGCDHPLSDADKSNGAAT